MFTGNCKGTGPLTNLDFDNTRTRGVIAKEQKKKKN